MSVSVNDVTVTPGKTDTLAVRTVCESVKLAVVAGWGPLCP